MHRNYLVSSILMKKVLILCVSLEKSIDRREIIKAQINKLTDIISGIELSFDFFNAIYGKDLAPEYLTFLNLRLKLSKQCHHSLGPGEFGCFLSHMILWQRLVDGQYTEFDRIIIIEDDVTFNYENINDKIHSLIDIAPPFAFLGGHNPTSRRRIRGYISSDQLFFNMTGPKDLYTATFAYSLTADQADQFIHKQIDKLSYIDDWKYLLKGSVLTPFYYCFDHNDDLESDIACDRSQFMTKPNRFLKNFNKIKNDTFSRIISIFIFKKIIYLNQFIAKSKK